MFYDLDFDKLEKKLDALVKATNDRDDVVGANFNELRNVCNNHVNVIKLDIIAITTTEEFKRRRLSYCKATSTPFGATNRNDKITKRRCINTIQQLAKSDIEYSCCKS